MPPRGARPRRRAVNEILEEEESSRNERSASNERSVTPSQDDVDAVANRIIVRLAEATGGNGTAREGCSFGDFKKHNPPIFTGEPDPIAAERWLTKIEKLLKVLNCTDSQKVKYATFVLEDAAERWWDGTELLLNEELGEDVPITWAKFKEVFNETYYPEIFKDRREREFADLVQGAMSVEQYAARFVELSRFAPHLIPDEGKRVRKFQRGLSDRFRHLILASGVNSYTETVKRAMALEEDFKHRDVVKDTRKRRFEPNDGQGKEHNFNNKKNSFNSGYVRTQNTQHGNVRPCPNCGKHHQGQPCRFGVKLCYTCKQPGHFSRECPTNKNMNPSSSQNNNAGKRVPGRVYALSAQDGQATDEVVTGLGVGGSE